VVTLRAIDRKLLRDAWRMRGQVIAIALVIIAGVSTYVSMISVMDTLEGTLVKYYADYRFADGFASVRRAPESTIERVRTVPGVAQVQSRVTAGVNLEIAGFAEPVAGLIVSIPDTSEPRLNRLFMTAGRLVEPGREEEVVLNETFAEAHGLRPGDALTAVINGRRRTLKIVGIALSPEFLMQVQPGTLFPDPERFGVLWMGRSALAAAYDMEGAFNDLAFTLAPGASIASVIGRVDLILEPYGGQGAYPRKDQPSNQLIQSELSQLRGMATLLPAVFLAVAAFLLHIVISRLITLQREQIAILKAFGYPDFDIGMHYLKLVLLIAVMGTAVGTALGAWLGQAMGELYLEFYRFPYLDYELRWQVVLTAGALTCGASMAGVIRAILRAVKLPPAEAMRPAPPAQFRPTFVERFGMQRLFDQPTRMILRSLERQLAKASLTIIGIASSCAILIMGLFWTDVIAHIVHVQFGIAQREHLSITFIEPQSTAAMHELRSLPGVIHAEPFRAAPVRLRNEHRSYDAAIQGFPEDATLRRLIDTELENIPIPAEGIVLTTRLAEILGLVPGDEVTVEVREGARRTRNVVVASLAEQYLGVGAFMNIDAANRLIGGGQTVSGAFLMIDSRFEDQLNSALRARPRVASIVSQDRAIDSYLETSAESLLVFTFILSLFAGVIAFGVVYNSVRISLSERDRELASLRVLGFTRGEVGYILLGEIVVLVLVAIPLGFILGAGACTWAVSALESDLFSFPVVLGRGTFAMSAVVVLAATFVSSLMARHQLNRLDLVGVLKSRE
jgi:putative ABC transport system permease protein